MQFEYRGKYMSGDTANGKIEAESREEVLSELRNRGIIPLSLQETGSLNKDLGFKKKLKNDEFVMFLRQFATLINTGVSVSEAIKTMAEQVKNPQLQEALEDMDKQVSRGEALSRAAGRYPKVFPELLIHMLEAGEASGELDNILNNMATYYEKQHKNRKAMVSSMIYPAVVGVVAIALTIFLLTFVVPTFADMFSSMGEDLPAYTKMVMAFSDFLQHDWWIPVLIVLAAIFGWKYAMQYEDVVYKVDALKLKIPIVGQLVHKSSLVMMTQTLSLLMSASIPILQALDITERVISNRVIQGIITEIRDNLAAGGTITEVIENYDVFPALLVQMIYIGETTGELDEMLSRTTTFYEEEVDDLSARVGTMVEPIMIVGLAFIVGSIVIAIVIPMFSMYESI